MIRGFEKIYDTLHRKQTEENELDFEGLTSIIGQLFLTILYKKSNYFLSDWFFESLFSDNKNSLYSASIDTKHCISILWIVVIHWSSFGRSFFHYVSTDVRFNDFLDGVLARNVSFFFKKFPYLKKWLRCIHG